MKPLVQLFNTKEYEAYSSLFPQPPQYIGVDEVTKKEWH